MSDMSLFAIVLGAIVSALVLRHVVRNRAAGSEILPRLANVATIAAVGGAALVLVGYLLYELAKLNEFTPVPAYLAVIMGVLGLTAALLVLLSSLVVTLRIKPPARKPASSNSWVAGTVRHGERVGLASLVLLKDIARIFLTPIVSTLPGLFASSLQDAGGEKEVNLFAGLNVETGDFDDEPGIRLPTFRERDWPF